MEAATPSLCLYVLPTCPHCLPYGCLPDNNVFWYTITTVLGNVFFINKTRDVAKVPPIVVSLNELIYIYHYSILLLFDYATTEDVQTEH